MSAKSVHNLSTIGTETEAKLWSTSTNQTNTAQLFQSLNSSANILTYILKKTIE